MVDPLLIRFKFHFEGKRPTNRLDKPEWMFTHILNVINDHATLLERECQPMVEQANLPWRAKQRFITELIGVVIEKLQNDMPRLVDHPALLSHAIAEALSFDADIRDNYGYRMEDNREWKGTVNVMIGQKSQFKHWLMVEKEFALARYEEIINEEGAWEWLINDNTYDQLVSFSRNNDHNDVSEQEEEPRPTKSADSLVHLMEVVTERYRPLSRISDRIRFLLEIQITILDQYRTEIISKADAYERTRFGALSMVQRQARDQISGLTGLKLLSRWTDSLLYVQSAMRDWSDDVFFLELWRDISQNAASTRPSPNVDGAWSESPTVNITDGHDEETTVFEEVIDAYGALVKRLQDLIVRSICQEVTHALKSYTRKRGWMASTHHMLKNADGELHDMEDNESDEHDQVKDTGASSRIRSRDVDLHQVQIMEISSELARPLAELAQMINFLNENLPRRVVTSILRSVAGTVDEWLWMRVVRTHQFGDAGARQLVVDFERGLASVGRQVIRRPERHYRKMRDTATLYQLPTNRELEQSTITDTIESSSSTSSASLTVEQVTHKLRQVINAKDTGSAQLLLDRLNVYSLSAEEALDVVERRITTQHNDNDDDEDETMN
ncbi:RINT-1/TIP-20 [Syncephalis plumigaleata]|nr:RINT-1/TIP-20 [Syncephalis plumigaleata]